MFICWYEFITRTYLTADLKKIPLWVSYFFSNVDFFVSLAQKGEQITKHYDWLSANHWYMYPMILI